MQSPNLMLFYVKNPLESATFYENIFEQKPVAAFPTYCKPPIKNGQFSGSPPLKTGQTNSDTYQLKC